MDIHRGLDGGESRLALGEFGRWRGQRYGSGVTFVREGIRVLVRPSAADRPCSRDPRERQRRGTSLSGRRLRQDVRVIQLLTSDREELAPTPALGGLISRIEDIHREPHRLG